MRRALLLCLIGIVAIPAASLAQSEDPDPDEFTPPGYAFCGWRDYQNGGWLMEWDDRLYGAGTVLFARDMTCRSARRNFARVRHGQQPTRAGYRCAVIGRDYEFADVRCTKVGRPRVAFRYQTGS